MFTERTITTNGIEMFAVEAGKGPLVLLCHGWPELSHSWRFQIAALAAAGFRAVAPDMRGFGRTSAPEAIEAYSIFHLVGDMVGLVAALGETRAMIVGHDWGAPVAWHSALFRPDIFTAVAGLCVPPPWRGRGRPLETLRAAGITNFYWQYFQTPGVAEAEFERDIDATFRAMLSGGFDGSDDAMYVDESKGLLAASQLRAPLPPWVTEDHIAHLVANYRRSGFRGGLNWYRNIDRNWNLTAPWQGARIHQPSAFIAGDQDAVVTGIIGSKAIKHLETPLANLREKLIIPGAGHWIQQERADEVSAVLIRFLTAAAAETAPR